MCYNVYCNYRIVHITIQQTKAFDIGRQWNAIEVYFIISSLKWRNNPWNLQKWLGMKPYRYHSYISKLSLVHYFIFSGSNLKLLLFMRVIYNVMLCMANLNGDEDLPTNVIIQARYVYEKQQLIDNNFTPNLCVSYPGNIRNSLRNILCHNIKHIYLTK